MLPYHRLKSLAIIRPHLAPFLRRPSPLHLGLSPGPPWCMQKKKLLAQRFQLAPDSRMEHPSSAVLLLLHPPNHPRPHRRHQGMASLV